MNKMRLDVASHLSLPLICVGETRHNYPTNCQKARTTIIDGQGLEPCLQEPQSCVHILLHHPS
jgi:hypothetical protein